MVGATSPRAGESRSSRAKNWGAGAGAGAGEGAGAGAVSDDWLKSDIEEIW